MKNRIELWIVSLMPPRMAEGYVRWRLRRAFRKLAPAMQRCVDKGNALMQSFQRVADDMEG